MNRICTLILLQDHADLRQLVRRSEVVYVRHCLYPWTAYGETAECKYRGILFPMFLQSDHPRCQN